jgi:hypothetical protein
MSNDPALRCPVCRATQTLRETCRRCQADLALVARAHRRVAYLKRERDAARAGGNQQREQAFAAELRWLAPAQAD